MTRPGKAGREWRGGGGGGGRVARGGGRGWGGGSIAVLAALQADA